MNNYLDALTRNPMTIHLESRGSKAVTSDNNNLDTKTAVLGQSQEMITRANEDYAAIDSLLKQQLEQEFLTPSNSPELEITSTPKYDPNAEELAIHFVTSNYQHGLQQGKNANELTKIINKSSENVRSAYSKTGSILDALGQLGPEQKSFISKSEYRVERALTSVEEDLYRRERKDSDQQLFELSVTTREGDVINIQFSSAQGYDELDGNTLDSFQLSYEVEGELSEQEHQALQGVFAQVGKMADDYFTLESGQGYNLFGGGANDNDFAFDILQGFDTGQLAGVDLAIGLWEGEEQDIRTNRIDFSYAFDEKSQQQSLSFDWVSGAREMSFAIDSSAIGGQDDAQLVEYLSLIDNSYEQVRGDAGQGQQSLAPTGIDIYKNALSSLFDLADRNTQGLDKSELELFSLGERSAAASNNMMARDERYQAMNSDENKRFSEGVSQLADFTSNFTLGDENQLGHIDLMIKQESAVTQRQDYTVIEQSKGYDLKTLSGYGETGTKALEQSEQYDIKTVTQAEQVLGVDQEQSYSKNEQTSADLGSGISMAKEVQTESFDSSSLRLIEDIWSQQLSHEKETSTQTEIYYGEKLAHDSLKTSYEASQTSNLIGDINKLTDHKLMREKYAPQMSQVNRLLLST